MIQFDGDSGVVRFENRSQGYCEGTTLTKPRNRHIKILLEGGMAENGSFSSLTNAEVLCSNLRASGTSEDWFKALIPPTWTSVSWTD